MSDAASKRLLMANKGLKAEFMNSLNNDSGFKSKDNISGSFQSSFDDTKRSSIESGTASSIDLQSSAYQSFGSMHDADLVPNNLRINKSPQKRRLADENCFSPKIKILRENSAKLVLKEKSRSENILIASTPIRAVKLGKFNSFMPSRAAFDSFDQEVEQIPSQTSTFQKPKLPALASLGKSHNFSSEGFDSFNLSSNFDQTDHTGDSNFNSLLTGVICDELETKISASTALDDSLEIPQHDSVKIPHVKKLLGSRRVSSTFIPKQLPIIHEISPKEDIGLNRRKVDILVNIKKHGGVDHLCMDGIMMKLDDQDLLSMCMVSTSWNEIVTNNKKTAVRRQQYLIVREATKENKLTSKSLEKKKDEFKMVKAFNICSGNVFAEQKYRSPPVSPSKKKFHENQKIVRKTSLSTKIIKCPTCSSPAIVKAQARLRTFKRKLKKKQKRGENTFLKQDSILKTTFNLNDSTSSSGSAASGDSSPGSPGSSTLDLDDSGCIIGQLRKEYEFAVCQKCYFKFCSKCKFENHPSKPCKFTPTTPPKQLNKSVACSEGSRKSLRRL